MRSARVEGYISADRADQLARWIGRVIETVRLDRLGHLQVDHPGLNDGDPLARVDPQDAVETIQPDDNSIFHRQGAAGETGSAAASHERNTVAIAGAHRGHHLRRTLGKNNGPGTRLEGGQGIGLIRGQLRGCGKQPPGRIGFLQVVEQFTQFGRLFNRRMETS